MNYLTGICRNISRQDTFWNERIKEFARRFWETGCTHPKIAPTKKQMSTSDNLIMNVLPELSTRQIALHLGLNKDTVYQVDNKAKSLSYFVTPALYKLD